MMGHNSLIYLVRPSSPMNFTNSQIRIQILGPDRKPVKKQDFFCWVQKCVELGIREIMRWAAELSIFIDNSLLIYLVRPSSPMNFTNSQIRIQILGPDRKPVKKQDFFCWVQKCVELGIREIMRWAAELSIFIDNSLLIYLVRPSSPSIVDPSVT